jgi:L-lactate dehydrogenase complex protein LldG
LIELERKSDARAAILKSIREHLSASAAHDAIDAEEMSAHDDAGFAHSDTAAASDVWQESGHHKDAAHSLLEMFKQSLESVGGRCIVVCDESEAAQALSGIINSLQATPLKARRIALSDAPVVKRLMRQVELDVDEITVTPNAAELFGYDVGITSAQAAIAETGTLVLESELERHRLVSLLPPVHVAIVEAASICRTIGEALSAMRSDETTEMSRAITFITGPSRTADIELTLAIGVHGPQELYVIIIESFDANE